MGAQIGLGGVMSVRGSALNQSEEATGFTFYHVLSSALTTGAVVPMGRTVATTPSNFKWAR